MRSCFTAFRLPKKGDSIAECEDAYWANPNADDVGDQDPQSLRVIVADGASESMLARRWASRLVTAFGTTPENLGTETGFLTTYQQTVNGWEAEVAQYKQERADGNSPIQWYEEPGFARGAYSTLLAVEFHSAAGGDSPRWTAAAVGDSCLFQVREGELGVAVPMDSSTDFSNQPALLSSKGTDAEVLGRYLTIRTGDLAPGDTYYLATDALSAWFLRMVETREAKHEPWRPLQQLDGSRQDEFADLIGKLRYDGVIRDDDTTLVRVDIDV